MGFLRAFNLKSWAEASRQMQLFDQRISAIEGVHGNFNPKADVNSGNVTTVGNLTAPTMPADAARYSDAMRYNYFTVFTRTMAANEHMFLGTSFISNTLSLTSPNWFPSQDIKITKIWGHGRQTNAANTGNVLFAVWIKRPDNTTKRLGNCYLRPYNSASYNNHYLGTYTLISSASSFIKKGTFTSVFAMGDNAVTRFDNLSMTVEFLAVDQ
jgi:hypothetical protein